MCLLFTHNRVKIIRRILIILAIILLFFTMMYLNGYRPSANSALSAATNQKSYIMQSIQNGKDRYALFSTNNLDLFGDCVLKRYFFGVVFKCDNFHVYPIKKDEPFMISGAIYNAKEYYIGVRVNDKRIKYIAVGAGNNSYKPNQSYTLSLDDVKDHPETYQYSTITNGYLVFYGKNYSDKAFSIRAFDKTGKLIADKFRGYNVRYVN